MLMRDRLLFLSVSLMSSASDMGTTALQVQDTQCNICPPGFLIQNYSLPLQTEAAARVSFDSAVGASLVQSNNLTCGDWEAYATLNTGFDCLALRDWLFRQCCEYLPPLYECEITLRETLLSNTSSRYDTDIPPISSGIAVNISLVVELFDEMDIVDHGIDGGAIEILCSLHLRWVDERLKWDSLTTPCTSVEVRHTDIWTPDLVPLGSREELTDTTAIVLPDGNVYWSRHGRMLFHCVTQDADDAKLCSVQLVDIEQGGHVHFILRDMLVNNPYGIPEYILNKKDSVLNYETMQSEGVTIQEVDLELDFLPLSNDCNICGATEAKLFNGTIREYPEDWLEFYPHTDGWSCSELDSLLTELDVSTEVCEIGRAYFEEACCDDTRLSYQCERQIHDAITETYNTITPGDPSPKEEDPFFSSKDAIDVQISLDISHALEIDVKSNSMQMLMSLELEWYDPRLVWEPFIGGCHRVSFRASVDAEQTEIWVPNVELVNMVRGVQSLPEAHATVRYDGYVRWRRTGVLAAICDLSGIEDFPFDQTECHMEFGGTMDPLFHRVNYVPANRSIEYSERVSDNSWNYQEYKLDTSKTRVSFRTEKLSGFENKLVRFEFSFSRARRYYVYLFVVLYIIFTYLAFGMFFVDFHFGERLGYGSSILFVIVAQDITLADSTPVTQEFLWIYRLSFGSKMFVVLGIVESIVVLYYYARDGLGDEKDDHGDDEETQYLIENNPSVENGTQSEDHDHANTTDTDVNDSQVEPVRSDTERKPRKQRRITSLTWWTHLLLPRGLDESDSRKKRRLKLLKAVDYAAAILFFVVYSIFLIVMFILAFV